MKIKTVVENEEGTFEFQAELSAQQHAFLLEYAIRDLIRKGLLPFLNVDNEADMAKIIPNPDDRQIQ